MQLVEIVSAANTDPDSAARAAAFTRHIDRLPLPVASKPGFLVNRILMPYLMEAVILESEGVPAPSIDQAALDFGMPMGPLELADTVGLDICLHVGEILGAHFGSEVPARLRELVAKGALGKKGGSGFYKWDGDTKGAPDKGGYNNPGMTEITDRLVLRFLNEAMACLREGVVADADLLDAGVIFGTGFAPFRGGPMHYIHNRGPAALNTRLVDLKSRYGVRFAPDAGWK
jgi:3-hydroxyacyl-CoA dehydrogenase/enoyl-CoA hydratase/3-hydroxybutyryl-CoA epimerase